MNITVIIAIVSTVLLGILAVANYKKNNGVVESLIILVGAVVGSTWFFSFAPISVT